MIGHFNAGELASYRAGTVSDGKAARISAHLTSCAQCADVHSGIGDVSVLLASFTAPPMPDRLAERLRAAIAEEVTQRAATSESRDGSPVLIPGRPDLPERGRRRVRRPRTRAWASPLLLRGLAAAGALVLLVGGGILLANERGVGTSSGVAEPAGTARPARNRPLTSPVGSTATIKLRYRHAGGFVFANAVTSDVNYTKATLPSGVRHGVANSAQVTVPSVTTPGASAAPEQNAVDHTTVGQLESCLATVATGGPVLLVELAHYAGQPATIIVFEPVKGAYDVIVVGDACGPTGQDVITRLVVPTK